MGRRSRLRGYTLGSVWFGAGLRRPFLRSQTENKVEMNISEMYQLRKKAKRSLQEERRGRLHKRVQIEGMDFETHVGIPTKLKLRMYVNLFLAIIILIVIIVKVIAHF
jgi:hypothetical protein